jgi:hypothetical protein
MLYYSITPVLNRRDFRKLLTFLEFGIVAKIFYLDFFNLKSRPKQPLNIILTVCCPSAILCPQNFERHHMTDVMYML